MALTPGTLLGPYEVATQIGAGGMGEVYKARDTKLHRDIALKVLPDSFAHDPDRLARFTREAQTLASLNHPNIAHIHGLEESGGVRALVMELVEGDDLSQRIARGAIPIDEALPITKQIAEALEAAHEQGIIHRDLKPANIKVRPDGTVKVLDFGLAKLTQAHAGAPDANVTASPTITSPAMMTGVGVLLGTAAYMSPEQAKGREADKRSDVWAFGAVLFEMLTGKRAFDGEDMTEVLGAVVRLEPNWETLPPTVPQPIQTLLHRCLVKDRRLRIADIAAARFVLDHQVDATAAGTTPSAPPPARSFVRRLAIPGALLAGAMAASAAFSFLQRPTPQPITRLTIAASGTAAVAVDINRRSLAVAPDGSKVIYTSADNAVYSANFGGNTARLFVRALDQLQPTLLAGPGSIREPFFSPDGEWIGFFEGSRLLKVPTAGGPPIPVATIEGNIRGTTWGVDSTIIYATGSSTTGLQRISANGGEPTTLTRPNPEKGESGHFWPHFLPDGQGVLFTIVPNGQVESAQIAVLDLRDGSQRVVLDGGSDARYVQGGYLVYGVAGTLRAVAFDLERLEVRGTPVPVVQQIVTTPPGATNFAVAANGTLTYVSGSIATTSRTLVWVDRQGREEPIKVPPRTYAYARLSPDGTRIALDVRDQQNDIWVWDLRRQTMTRLTFDPGIDQFPVWTPDGRRIAFNTQGAGGERLYWQAADGTGVAEALTSDPLARRDPSSFSPDGTRLLFGQTGAANEDVGMLALDGAHRTELLLKGAYNEQNAEVSPDGRWLAYQSTESGRVEIYGRPFPNVDGGKWQVSTDGGTRPLWARDGRELFYFIPGRGVMGVPIQPGATFTAGAVQTVVSGADFVAPNAGRQYDVSPDGRRFLMIKDAPRTGEGSPLQLVIVQNWLEELKRLVPTE